MLWAISYHCKTYFFQGVEVVRKKIVSPPPELKRSFVPLLLFLPAFGHTAVVIWFVGMQEISRNDIANEDYQEGGMRTIWYMIFFLCVSCLPADCGLLWFLFTKVWPRIYRICTLRSSWCWGSSMYRVLVSSQFWVQSAQSSLSSSEVHFGHHTRLWAATLPSVPLL